jgi:Na+/proline symporter
MNKTGRSQLALGIILILIGGWFLLNQTMPEFRDFFEPYTEWPSNMLLIGAGILVIGLATGSPGLAVPAAIVAGLGGIFYYQEATGNYDSWSFMWALIPGFVGVGTVLQGLLGENTASNLKKGLNLMVISAVLFLVFAAFLGGWNILGNYGPAVLLILLGLWVLGSGLYRTYRNKGE